MQIVARRLAFLITLIFGIFVASNIQIAGSKRNAILSTSVNAMPSPAASTHSVLSIPPDKSLPACPSPVCSAKLAAFNGVVENLFFHPVVAYPELAFNGNYKQKGIDTYMVTVKEYKKMLQSIYDKGYILVSMNDVWCESTDAGGQAHMTKNTLMIPEGKKPLILTYDDVNYYDYMVHCGFTHKLVVRNGEIWRYGLDPKGYAVYSQDLDVVTIMDKFVKQHPDFS